MGNMRVVIKRYQNRKLYNTQTKRYITLDEIEDLIKNQQEIEVIDNQTGDDITSVTLSQVIFETEKNRNGLLPLKLLTSIVQSGGNRLDDLRKNVFNSLNLYHFYDEEIKRRIDILIQAGDLSEENGNNILVKLLSVNTHQENISELERKVMELLYIRQTPTKDDLRPLIKKIDELSQELDVIDKLND
jgi:polyhydroxyalkanoate synthesis repressor PhaR